MVPTFDEIDDIFDCDNKPKLNSIKVQKYTPEQHKVLETKYIQNPFPSLDDRKNIEKLLGIETDQDQLLNWFCYRRRKRPDSLEKMDATVYYKRLPAEKMYKITKFYEKFGSEEIPREKILTENYSMFSKNHHNQR